MTQPSSDLTETDSNAVVSSPSAPSASPSQSAQPSYVKLAMRNMVRKRGTSLFHFALTVIGLLTVLVGLSYLTR